MLSRDSVFDTGVASLEVDSTPAAPLRKVPSYHHYGTFAKHHNNTNNDTFGSGRFLHHERIFKDKAFGEKEWQRHTSWWRYMPEPIIMCAPGPLPFEL